MHDHPKAFANAKRIIRKERRERSEPSSIAPPSAATGAPASPFHPMNSRLAADAAVADTAPSLGAGDASGNSLAPASAIAPAQPSPSEDQPAEASQPSPATAPTASAPEQRRAAPAGAKRPFSISRAKRFRRLSYLANAAAVALALGLGWALGASSRSAPAMVNAASQESVRALSGDLLRVAGDLRSLKGGLDALGGNLDRSRSEQEARMQQLGDRMDHARPDQETATRVAALVERFGRLESGSRDSATRLAQVMERLDRMEKTLLTRTAAVTAPVAGGAANPAAVDTTTQTGSIPEAKPQPTKPRLDNWILREVYGGIALVEGQTGSMMEIAPGQSLPGAGRVESIERRGKSWVVVTSRGLIVAQ